MAISFKEYETFNGRCCGRLRVDRGARIHTCHPKSRNVATDKEMFRQLLNWELLDACGNTLGNRQSLFAVTIQIGHSLARND